MIQCIINGADIEIWTAWATCQPNSVLYMGEILGIFLKKYTFSNSRNVLKGIAFAFRSPITRLKYVVRISNKRASIPSSGLHLHQEVISAVGHFLRFELQDN